MKLTKHAEVRCQQRGIPVDLLPVLLRIGKRSWKPGGAREIQIKKKDMQRLVQSLHSLARRIEKASHVRVITADDHEVITVYHA